MIRRILRCVAIGVFVPWLVACASVEPRPAAPLLRLGPALLGQSLALQQQLIIERGDQAQRLDVLLETDAQSVRLVALSLGQTAARLEWDGTTLTQWRAPWWPAAVRAERILSDLQLMLWPAAAITAALPEGWTLNSSSNQRTLSLHGVAVIRVDYLDTTKSELEHLTDGYRIRVESRAAGGPS